MDRIVNVDAIPKINDAVCKAETILEQYPQLTENQNLKVFCGFKGVSEQLDLFKDKVGLVWILSDFVDGVCHFHQIPLEIKPYEFVKVRKDILDKLYAAIDEVTDMLYEGKDIAFGNVMEARDELECGKTYEELGRNQEIVTHSVIGEVHSMDEVYVINEVSKFHGET